MYHTKKKILIDNINIHNLTPKNIRELIVDHSKIDKAHGFWHNDVLNIWCISGAQGNVNFCTESEYWLGIYDDGPAVKFTCDGGIRGYEIENFFIEKDIENEQDYLIQYHFIEKMNRLIAEGIFACPWENF